MARFPLSASAITRQVNELAEDTEAQLLEDGSQLYTIWVDESTDVDNKVTMLVLCDTFFRRLCVGIRYVHFCCKQHHCLDLVALLECLLPRQGQHEPVPLPEPGLPIAFNIL